MMADLAVIELASVPIYPTPGEPVELHVGVINRTVRPAPAVDLVIYERGEPIGRQAVDIGAFASHQEVFHWKPTIAGVHTLTARLDPDGRISEFNRADNQLDQAIVVAERPPAGSDVEIVEITCTEADEGLTRRRIRLRNNGDAPVTTLVELREPDGRSDALLGGPIPAGGEVIVDSPLHEACPGKGFRAEANPRFRPEEINQANNVLGIVPLETADLAVAKLTFHERKEGTSFSHLLTVSFRIINNGPADVDVPFQTTISMTGATTDSYTLKSSALPAGEVVYVSHTFKRPTGDFEVKVEVDKTATVLELFESNNVATWKLRGASLEPGRWVSIGPRRLTAGSLDAIGRLYHIAISPKNSSIIYVGVPSPYGTKTGSGVWKTTDGGRSWFPVSDSFDTCAITGLAIDPSKTDRVFAITPLGLYRSDDAGESWIKIYDNPILLGSRLLIDPNDSNRLVSISYLGVYRSKDGGATWNEVLDGLPTDLVRDQNDPKTLYTALYHANDTSVTGVYRSSDRGESWHKLTGCSGDGFPTIAADTGITLATSGSTLFMGLKRTGSFKLFKTTATTCTVSGKSQPSWQAGWTTTDAISEVKADPTDASYVYAYWAGGGFYVSTDGGSQLSLIKGKAPHVDHHGYAADPSSSKIIYALSDGGVFKSTDHGKQDSWALVGEGICNFEIYDLAHSVTEPDLVICGAQDNGTILYDGTSTVWEEIYGGDGATVAIDPTDADTMYFMNQYADSVARRVNGSTASIACGLPTGKVCGKMPFQLHPGTPTTLIASCTSLYRVDKPDCSASTPSKWSKVLTPASGAGSVGATAIDGANDLYYAGTSAGHIYCGRDSSNWQDLYAHSSAWAVTDLELDPFDSTVLYSSFGGSSGSDRIYRMVRSANPPGKAFITARDITGDLPDSLTVNTLAIDLMSPWTVLAGTTKGVYRGRSSDQGTTWKWTFYNTGMPAGLDIIDLEVHPKTGVVRAATMGRGAYEMLTGAAIGSGAAVQGKVAMLRVHDVGTGYGSPNDFLDGEVVVRLDTTGDLALGFQLRSDTDEQLRRAMLKVLRDAFAEGANVKIDYIRTGFRVGTILRVIESE